MVEEDGWEITEENFSSEAKTDYGKRLSEQLARVAAGFTDGAFERTKRGITALEKMIHPFSKFDRQLVTDKEENQKKLKEALDKLPEHQRKDLNVRQVLEAHEAYELRRWELVMDSMQRSGFLGGALIDWQPQ